MSIIDLIFAKRPRETASVAKERLQIVLAHERANREAPEFLPILQRELLDVVAKYVDLGDDALMVVVDRQGDNSILEISVELDKARIRRLDRPPSSAVVNQLIATGGKQGSREKRTARR
jgi:cell division topological specificity factor